MLRALLLPLFLALSATTAGARTQYALESGELTYVVTHPLHHVEGVSHEVRGKGVFEGSGDFLAAARLASFQSGDANRDAHMLQTMRGGEFPLVLVRASLPEEPKPGHLTADLEVEMSGRRVHYAAVPFDLAESGADRVRLTGTVPMSLKDFRLKPPALLGVPIKDEVPVRVDLVWKKL